MNKNTKMVPPTSAESFKAMQVSGIPSRTMLIPQGFTVNVSSEKKYTASLTESKVRIAHRLLELANLKKGWYDGEQGQVFSMNNILKFRKFFLDKELLYIASKPYIYPTIEGGLSIEWDFKSVHATLDVDMNTFKAELSYYSDNIEYIEDNTIEYNLKLKKDWFLLELQFSDFIYNPTYL